MADHTLAIQATKQEEAKLGLFYTGQPNMSILH
jgi:hypothetical protein